MATTDTELKKLNSTVDEAVKILKMYVGNSAQMKNMDEKQKQAIQKWFDVGQETEEVVKKQRAFTERERDESGKFLKKQEKNALTILGIAKSVGGFFEKITSSITSSLISAFRGISDHVKSFFSNVKSHFLGLFGEESEWFGLLSSIKDSMTGFFKWAFSGFLKKTPAWAEKVIKLLRLMSDQQMKEWKSSFFNKGEKGKGNTTGILAILGGIAFTAAAVVGVWLRQRLKAAELILKGLKIDKLFIRIGRWFSELGTKIMGRFKWAENIGGFLGKFGQKVKSIFGWIKKAYMVVEELPFIGKFIGIFGKLLKGFKFGFKLFGWPVTLLFAIIDFVKGFMNTTGDWQQKLMGGLKAVFHGLIDLPLEILGWAWDKLMGLFGIESEGTGAKLKQWFDDIMNFVLEFGPIGIITDVIKAFQTGDWKGIFMKRLLKVNEIMLKIWDWFVGVWNGLFEWMVEKTKDIPVVGDIVKNLAEKMSMQKPTLPEPLPDTKLNTMQKGEEKKTEMQKEQTDKITEAVDRSTEASKNATKGTNAVLASMNNNQQGGGAVSEQKQIPDELDNNIINFNNYSGGLN